MQEKRRAIAKDEMQEKRKHGEKKMDKERIAELAEKYYPYVRELRHEFHKNPELSWKEIRTSRRVMEELERMGVPYQAHCGNETNVAAYIKGSGSGLGKAKQSDYHIRFSMQF